MTGNEGTINSTETPLSSIFVTILCIASSRPSSRPYFRIDW